MKDSSLIPWHAQSVEDVLAAFDVGEEGLTQEQVESHAKQYGLNQTAKKRQRSAIGIFAGQFAGPFMIILIFACGVSIFLQEWLDVGVIIAAMTVNVILGFVEEYKADRSLAKLIEFLPQEARVRRNGVIESVPASEVVPGDIVLFKRGDKVIADARIISSESFEVNEAVLTGESSAVEKSNTDVEQSAATGDRVNMVFAGTNVTAGTAEAVVVATAMNTEIGKITGLVQESSDEKTPLQKQLHALALAVGGGVLALTVAIFLLGIARGQDPLEIFAIAVALAVSAVPEGLAVAMTVILAVGMQRILKKDALVRKLVASETLGSVSVICVDKTGTLTTGEMDVVALQVKGKSIALDAATEEAVQLRQAAANALFIKLVKNEKGKEAFDGSPTEFAFAQYLTAYTKIGEWTGEVAHALPFDSTYKFSARILNENGTHTLYALGAPDVLLERCDISDNDRKAYFAQLESLTERGYRVLLAAKKDVAPSSSKFTAEQVHDLKPVGFFGLQDPLRSEVIESIKQAKSAGLIPVMLTGDHKITAVNIAREAGLIEDGGESVTGAELEEMSDQELARRVPMIKVYARVSPSHKLRIVRAWQARGHAVAMTGDGVNDAPAIKVADIGIAVGSGTEVAKETADMVLLNNSFSTIVAAIREGRVIFENIRKVVVYLLADSLSALVLVAGALIFGLPLPLLPAQILWINFITDGLPAMALTFEPGEPGIMKEPPRKKSEPILNIEMKTLILAVGLATDVIVFAVFFYLLGQDWTIEKIRTFIFLKMGFSTLLYVFAIRSLRKSAFASNPFSNLWLVAAVITGAGLQVFPLLFPPLRNLFAFELLSPIEWAAVLGLSLINLILIEIGKAIFHGFRSRA